MATREGTWISGYEPLVQSQYAAQRSLQSSIHYQNELRNELRALARAQTYMSPRQLRAYIKSRPIFNAPMPNPGPWVY